MSSFLPARCDCQKREKPAPEMTWGGLRYAVICVITFEIKGSGAKKQQILMEYLLSAVKNRSFVDTMHHALRAWCIVCVMNFGFVHRDNEDRISRI